MTQAKRQDEKFSLLKKFRSSLPILLFLTLTACETTNRDSAYYGKFVGDLQLAPMPSGQGMRLLTPYEFIDSSGGSWLAPAGTISDGASIPQVAKSFVGGSWDGPYRNAAIIHDVACVKKDRPWELVHLTFYHAMLASKVPIKKAKIMYAAVYHFGPRWEGNGPTYKPKPKSVIALEGLNGIGGALSGGILGGIAGGVHVAKPAINSEINERTIERVTRMELQQMIKEIEKAEREGKSLTIEQIQNL